MEEKAVPSPFLPRTSNTLWIAAEKPTMKEGGPEAWKGEDYRGPTRPDQTIIAQTFEAGIGAGVEGNEGGCFLDYPFFLMGLPSHLDPSPKFS